MPGKPKYSLTMRKHSFTSLFILYIYIYYTYSCDSTHTDCYLTHTIIMNKYIINCKIKSNHALKIFRVSKVENINCVSKLSNIIQNDYYYL